jgi:hypothetical protein
MICKCAHACGPAYTRMAVCAGLCTRASVPYTGMLVCAYASGRSGGQACKRVGCAHGCGVCDICRGVHARGPAHTTSTHMRNALENARLRAPAPCRRNVGTYACAHTEVGASGRVPRIASCAARPAYGICAYTCMPCMQHTHCTPRAFLEACERTHLRPRIISECEYMYALLLAYARTY